MIDLFSRVFFPLGTKDGKGDRKETGNEKERGNEQGTENAEENCSDFENLYYNLEAGIPTDEDISKCQQSTEDLYEEIQFPERLESQGSETATENTSMEPKTSCHVIETVTTDTQCLAVKERIVAKEDTEKQLVGDILKWNMATYL